MNEAARLYSTEGNEEGVDAADKRLLKQYARRNWDANGWKRACSTYPVSTVKK